MTPPASKKRRTNQGHAVPVLARPASPPHQPSFSIEILTKIASFVNTKNNDLFNICVAVGPIDSPIIRRVWLTSNSRYLWRVTKKNLLDPMDLKAVREELNDWMGYNPDWRNRCKEELVHDDRWSSPRICGYGHGKIKIRANPSVLFNNPAAAIELGMVDILKHLVEGVGIDINSYGWSGYTSTGVTKQHLLVLAAKQKDKACFDYLMSTQSANVNAGISKRDRRPVWLQIFLEGSVECTRAMINHPTFDSHKQFWDTTYRDWYLPIQFVCLACVAYPHLVYTKQYLAKTQMLLEAGVDPALPTPQLSAAEVKLARNVRADLRNSHRYQISVKLLSIIKKHKAVRLEE